VPATQLEHTRFAVTVPRVWTLVPAGQVRTGVQLASLGNVVKLTSATQSTQVRSEIAVPGVRTAVPAAQVR
jgi:hypothetical protein